MPSENQFIYDENGTVIGTRNSNTPTKDLTSNLRKNSTEYNLEPSVSADSINVLQYPADNRSQHFVRFYINIQEESRVVKENLVGVTGDADYSEQNRGYTNSTDKNAVQAAGALAGGLMGGKVGSSRRVMDFVRNDNANPTQQQTRTQRLKGAAKTGGVIAAGAAVGAAAGYAITSLAIDSFKLTQKMKRLACNITLYTPDIISTTYSMQYNTVEDLLLTLSQHENYEAIKDGISNLFSSDIGNATGAAARILATGNSTISGLSRTSINKRMDIMFHAVSHRNFQFRYVFAPRTPEEAKTVDDIIFAFKYFAHPEILEGYANFLYLYPAEFDIEYGQVIDGNETKNPYLNKISTCVLEDMNVNYSSGGNSAFVTLEKGEPVSVALTLVFKEIETLHRDRIAKGY